jgi:hypothetical protein
VRPDHPILTSAAFDEVVGVSAPTFAWVAIPKAATYILQIDRNFYFASADLHTYPGIGTNAYTIPDTLTMAGGSGTRLRSITAARRTR